MVEFNMDVRRITRMVQKTKADAWVVMAGSHDCWNGAAHRALGGERGEREKGPAADADSGGVRARRDDRAGK
jgi:hypothetical protein